MKELIGDESTFPLEHRIYNMILLFGAILCFVVSIYKYYVYGPVNTILILLSGIILLYLYYLSRRKRQYVIPMSVGIFLFILIVTPFTWLTSSGSLGSTPYFYIVISSMVAILFSGLKRSVTISLLITTAAILMFVEYKYPHLIAPYATSLDRYIDISVSLAVAIIANVALFVMVFNSYNKENKRSAEYLARIEKQKVEIEFRKDLELVNKELTKAEKRYRNFVENINEIIFSLDTGGVITYISPAIEKVSLYKVDEVTGKPFTSLVHYDDLPAWQNNLEHVMGGKSEPCHFRMLDKDGTIRHFRTSSRPLTDDNQLAGITGALVDITERKQLHDELVKHREHLEEIVKERTAELNTANNQLQREMAERELVEERLRYLATHDYLTGIPNRYTFEETLRDSVAMARCGKLSALLFIDIDNFKLVNDTKGHAAGDRLLISIARSILSLNQVLWADRVSGPVWELSCR